MPARFLRYLLICLAVVAVTLPSFFCNSPEKTAAEATGSPWRNVYETSVHYVGMQTCRTCHEAVYQTFIETGMGQSFYHATREKSVAEFGHAPVYDKYLDFYYKPYMQNDSLYIMEYRVEAGDTTYKKIQKIDYIVGSGQHTNSNILSVNGYFYQAPITYYAQKKQWDLAPGFENGNNTRFNRLIEIECMSCHNGYPDFVANSQNKYLSVKMGIDCERCHGPGSLHVAEKQAGKVDTSKGPDYSIVNPRRLSTELQNNVCQRCHLQGIAVLNDGKSFFDFRPGMHLSEVMNVFMPQYEGARDKMIMASHVERMKKSDCYVSSGKMSCITCHDPHISVKSTPRSKYLNACQSCHGGIQQIHCSEDMKVRVTKKDDCVTCHMPHNGSIDIPHVAVTDHYIRKRPQRDTLEKKITAFLGLKCFNNDSVDAITTARAYMEFFERYNPNKGLIDSALYYLSKQADVEASQKQNRDYVRAYFLLNDYNKVTQYAQQLQPQNLTDAWACYRIGESYYQLQQVQLAVPWYRRATEIWPYALDFQTKYGTSLLASGNIAEAQKVFNFVVNENPAIQIANNNLGFIYLQQGNSTMSYDYLRKALAIDPDHEQTLINMAVWYHNNGNNDLAQRTLKHLLKKYPGNKQAKAMLLDLQ